MGKFSLFFSEAANCGTIMSINMCVCIYIYIYAWMYVCESVCIRGWVAKEGILSSASLTGIRVSKGTPLSTLAQRPHKELYPQKPARVEEKNEESQLEVRLWSSQSKVERQSVRSETPKWRVRHSVHRTWGWAVKNKDMEQ